ncbi:MAG TPA: toll/interleukin-1 receptor domain-containing protein [Propionibacteriaceae bacterium]
MVGSVAGAAGRIFLSYRRQETAYSAGWLYDRLAKQYGGGQVFKDVDSIELGDDFVRVISRAVESCDVLLAMIGERWLTITDEHGRRRLDDPEDFVRLEIEAALARDVRVIPILIDGAGMPRADELPLSLVPLTRRQALELSPNRFEHDTGRLLKVLDTTLAEVRSASEDAATSTAAAPQTVPQGPPGDGSAAGGTAPGVPAKEDSRTPQRRLLTIGVSLAALVAILFTARSVLDQPSLLNEEAPWRLVIRQDGSSSGCTVTLVDTVRRETWSNPNPVWGTASFLMSEGGTFRWSAEPHCTAFSRPGPGSLTLPAVVDGAGTSDAFEAPAVVKVSVKDFHSNERCLLELRDVATGTVVDRNELNKQHNSVALRPYGRPLVYLVHDICAVQVSAG